MDPPAYRPPRQIPASLRDTLKIILEEELFLSGIDLLTSLIAQGTSTRALSNNLISSSTDTHPPTPPPPPPPIYIPPPIHLTLLTTLLCHPTFTTHISKKSDRDSHLVPSSSERLLLRLLSLTGPTSMDLLTAWGRWSGTPSGTNGLWASRRRAIPAPHDAFEDNSLDLKLAGKDSLFERVEDFWAVVGWGFACACAEVGYHVDAGKARALKKRWGGAWRRVLGVMIEGLERDWEERCMGEEGEQKSERLRKSLIVRWLPSKRGGAGYKRVVRAVMANGKGRMGMEWKEVWRDEGVSLKEIRMRKEKRNVKKLVPLTKEEEKEAKRRAILEDSSPESEEEEENSPSKNDEPKVDIDGDYPMHSPTDDLDTPPTDLATSAWGGTEAVLLRQRLLILLSSVCHHGQWIPLPTLHDELTDHLLSPTPPSLSLPSLGLFTTLLVTNNSPLSHAYLTSPPPAHTYLHPLFSSLLRTLLSSDAPSPSNYGAVAEDKGGLITPKVLILCYMPYSAKTGTLRDNLIVATLLEQLLRAIGRERGGVEGLIGEDGGAFLVGAMEDGVERRMQVVVKGVKEADEGVGDSEGGKGKGVGMGVGGVEGAGEGGQMGRKRKRGERGRELEWGELQEVEARLRGLVEVICS